MKKYKHTYMYAYRHVHICTYTRMYNTICNTTGDDRQRSFPVGIQEDLKVGPCLADLFQPDDALRESCGAPIGIAVTLTYRVDPKSRNRFFNRERSFVLQRILPGNRGWSDEVG